MNDQELKEAYQTQIVGHPDFKEKKKSYIGLLLWILILPLACFGIGFLLGINTNLPKPKRVAKELRFDQPNFTIQCYSSGKKIFDLSKLDLDYQRLCVLTARQIPVEAKGVP